MTIASMGCMIVIMTPVIMGMWLAAVRMVMVMIMT